MWRYGGISLIQITGEGGRGDICGEGWGNIINPEYKIAKYVGRHGGISLIQNTGVRNLWGGMGEYHQSRIRETEICGEAWENIINPEY